ncbi:hypothetical protein GBS0709_06180 [Edwardsiella tarda]|nr:hypothetical protein GBS0709_06180 [Edwardsiella tarda]
MLMQNTQARVIQNAKKRNELATPNKVTIAPPETPPIMDIVEVTRWVIFMPSMILFSGIR